jgi:hypothetical protein
VIRTAFACLLQGGLLLAAALAPELASAAECEAYYPFDGSLADVSGGHDGQMIGEGGTAAKPSFVEGRTGQALELTGTSTMRAYLDVHPDLCPQLTILAWLRVDPSIAPTRMVVSTGTPQSPGFHISSGILTVHGPGNGLSQRDVFRPLGGWTFVAAVYDFDRKTYTLHWRGRQVTREQPDGWRDPEEALWVGAMNDLLAHPSPGVAIDDLRVIGRALDADQLARLQQNGTVGSVDQTATASSSEWQGPSCAAHEDCGTGNYCGFDNLCHPDRHAPKRDLELQVADAPLQTAPVITSGEPDSAGGQSLDETLAGMREGTALSPEAEAALTQRVEESRPPEITYDSDQAALEAEQQREQEARDTEQLPAPRINAVMDLQTLWIRDHLEDPGDEFYLVRYELRGRLGEGDRIYTFDYGDQVWPIVAGEDWARAGRDFSIPQGAGRFTFNDLEPFEVYGFVAVLMEANNNTVEERTYAFGFGEFQNENGVTQTVSSAFARAVPRDVAPPDYNDTSCRNITSVFQTIEAGITRHFGDYNDSSSGLPKAILDVIAAPLQRNRRDRLEGVMWSFYMNAPGGERGQHCLGNPTPTLFPPPGSPMLFDTGYTRVTGEHRQ